MTLVLPGWLLLKQLRQGAGCMQANLKHYANMNHLPPGDYLSDDPGDQVCQLGVAQVAFAKRHHDSTVMMVS